VYTNRIERVEERINKHQFSHDLDDEEIFFFNPEKKLGDGSDKSHLNIMMTSKALMYKCENKGVFHIDGTYKLIKNRFPVMGNNIIFILILI